MGKAFDAYTAAQNNGADLVADLTNLRRQAERWLVRLNDVTDQAQAKLDADKASEIPLLDADDLANVQAILNAMKTGGPSVDSTEEDPAYIPGLTEISAKVDAMFA